jgi:hypothetical protein
VVRLGPAQADPDRQRSLLGGVVGGTRITGHVQARYADATGGAGDVHHRIQYGGGPLGGRLTPVAACLEPHGVDRAVDLRYAQDLFDLVLRVPLGYVDRLAAEARGFGQPVRVQVADDYDRCTQQHC